MTYFILSLFLYFKLLGTEPNVNFKTRSKKTDDLSVVQLEKRELNWHDSRFQDIHPIVVWFLLNEGDSGYITLNNLKQVSHYWYGLVEKCLLAAIEKEYVSEAFGFHRIRILVPSKSDDLPWSFISCWYKVSMMYLCTLKNLNVDCCRVYKTIFDSHVNGCLAKFERDGFKFWFNSADQSFRFELLKDCVCIVNKYFLTHILERYLLNGQSNDLISGTSEEEVEKFTEVVKFLEENSSMKRVSDLISLLINRMM